MDMAALQSQAHRGEISLKKTDLDFFGSNFHVCAEPESFTRGNFRALIAASEGVIFSVGFTALVKEHASIWNDRNPDVSTIYGVF